MKSSFGLFEDSSKFLIAGELISLNVLAYACNKAGPAIAGGFTITHPDGSIEEADRYIA